MGLNIYRTDDVIMEDVDADLLDYVWNAVDVRLTCEVDLADDDMPDELRQKLLASGCREDECVTISVQ